MWPGLIERYAAYLPVNENTPRITLNEGNTPLVRLPRVSEQVGCEVFAKYEGLNPTGSFKDRGMTMAVSKAVEEGAKAVICASTGNTSASAAAYAARAGIKCWVLLPAGKIAKENWLRLCFTVLKCWRYRTILTRHWHWYGSWLRHYRLSWLIPLTPCVYRGKRLLPSKSVTHWEMRRQCWPYRWAMPVISALTGWDLRSTRKLEKVNPCPGCWGLRRQEQHL